MLCSMYISYIEVYAMLAIERIVILENMLTFPLSK